MDGHKLFRSMIQSWNKKGRVALYVKGALLRNAQYHGEYMLQTTLSG